MKNKYLLHPKYWLLWIGIIILYLITFLPYPLLYYIGILLGKTISIILPKRVKIAKVNLQLCFPYLSNNFINHLLKKNFESVGLGIIETGIAWFWPSWRIKKHTRIIGLEHITSVYQKKGILLIGIHFLTLEIGARTLGIYTPGIGVYRPNNNKLLELLQIWGRLRSNKLLLNRYNIKGMIRSLKNKEILWYAPDHDYGQHNSMYVPFFEMQNTSTTKGIYFLIKHCKPIIITYVPRRLQNKFGYEIIIIPYDNYENNINNEFDALIFINKIIETTILIAPEQYMWLHRRFKTRPINENSVYI